MGNWGVSSGPHIVVLGCSPDLSVEVPPWCLTERTTDGNPAPPHPLKVNAIGLWACQVQIEIKESDVTQKLERLLQVKILIILLRWKTPPLGFQF